MNCIAWISMNVNTRFIAHTDDDAFFCMRTLYQSLALLPRPTHGLILGWQRKDSFDDEMIIMSRDAGGRVWTYRGARRGI